MTPAAAGAFHGEHAPEISGLFLCRHGAKVRLMREWIYSAFLYCPPQGLPVSSIIYPGDAGRPEYFGGFPAMNAGAATEDDGPFQVFDPSDADPYAIYGNIQGPGNMSLVEFVGCPQVDDHAAFL